MASSLTKILVLDLITEQVAESDALEELGEWIGEVYHPSEEFV